MLKVLITDDEQMICNLIANILDWEDMGFQIIGMANTGTDAFDIIQKEKPDVVISDIRMPGYDGIQLIQKTAEAGIQAVFVMISGYKQFEYAQNAMKYGVKYYLLKPISELEKIVHERKDRKTETLADANIAQRDLIKEIQEIISSLENITIRQKNAEILMKVAEINNLQDQINPHFLYNTLEVIRGEALINGDKKVAEMTEALANYFRYNISRKETFVYLKDELKNICNYFKIQQHRFGERISFEIVYHGIAEKDVQNCYIPKLILQPIVENSIYHGLEMKIGGGVIKIHISSADDKLMLTIADDGLGMTQEDLDKLNRDVDAGKTDENAAGSHNGVALQNIKRRLKLYWGKEAYMIATSTLNYGTEMHLMLPLLFTKEDYMKS